MTLSRTACVAFSVAVLIAGTPPATQSVEGTEWRMLQIGGETVAGDAPQGEPTINLDAERSQASGTGGCNGYTGGYTLDGDQIRFTQIASTRRMCPEGMDTEDAFFYALETARTYAVVDGNLELYDAGGERLARFAARPSPAG